MTGLWLCAPCSEGRCLLRGSSFWRTCDSCGKQPRSLCREVICSSHADDGNGVCDDCGYPAEANTEAGAEWPNTLFVQDAPGPCGHRAATESEIGAAGYVDAASLAHAVEQANLYFAKAERQEKDFRNFAQEFASYLSNRECDKEAYDFRQRYAQVVLSWRET
jgi:hypothetical protein